MRVSWCTFVFKSVNCGYRPRDDRAATETQSVGVYLFSRQLIVGTDLVMTVLRLKLVSGCADCN